ncbi:hypothetical protein ACJ41I_01345 [Bifidobacterium catenulatum]|uniref:hypothetical protein n=1 Tax=Bifidobacterium catenulatum TaxID=1686 RepID=UPI003D33506C
MAMSQRIEYATQGRTQTGMTLPAGEMPSRINASEIKPRITEAAWAVAGSVGDHIEIVVLLHVVNPVFGWKHIKAWPSVRFDGAAFPDETLEIASVPRLFRKALVHPRATIAEVDPFKRFTWNPLADIGSLHLPHFGFSLESFSLVVTHSHDALLLRR